MYDNARRKWKERENGSLLCWIQPGDELTTRTDTNSGASHSHWVNSRLIFCVFFSANVFSGDFLFLAANIFALTILKCCQWKLKYSFIRRLIGILWICIKQVDLMVVWDWMKCSGDSETVNVTVSCATTCLTSSVSDRQPFFFFRNYSVEYLCFASKSTCP